MAKERKITLPLSVDLLEKLANFQEIELHDVIIDLEDAVALTEKETSRSKVRDKILEHAERKIIVRVNSLDSPFFEGDLNLDR